MESHDPSSGRITIVPESSGQCTVARDSAGQDVSLYYEVYRFESSTSETLMEEEPGEAEARAEPSKKPETQHVVFIMGFAAAGVAWIPLLLQLRRLWAQHPGPALELLIFDNRGMGNSSSPVNRKDYTTPRMAEDTIALMDKLGWSKAHIVGFSMGGMISIKLAAMAPQRIKSLAVLSSTGGGHQCLPRTWKAVKYAFQAILAKTADIRAEIDLKFHFKKSTLKKQVPHISGVSRSVRDLLKAEYLNTQTANRPQPECGVKGQASAVWNHTVTDLDVSTIKNSKVPVWFLHGRHDLAASAHFAEQLAARFAAPCVLVDGAHFIPRENAVELALLLQSLFSLGHASMAATAAAGFHRTSLEGLALQMGVMKPHMSPHDALVASGAATHTNSGNSNTYGTNKNASNGNGNSSSSSHTAVSVGALNSPGLKTPLTESVV